MKLASSSFVTIAIWSVLITLSYGNEDIVVRIKDGNETVAKRIAAEHGLEYVEEHRNIRGIYLFHEKIDETMKRDDDYVDVVKKLENLEQVHWAERHKELHMVPKSKPPLFDTRQIDQSNDPYWNLQWYMNGRQNNDVDLRVLPVWKMNITGRGVRVVIVDDGLDYTHPDLKKNYDPTISYDYIDHDNDPISKDREHGTSCASVIGMEKDNGICGAGIAFNAKVGGVRLTGGNLKVWTFGQGLSHQHKIVDIYSCSWGPKDDGKTTEKIYKIFEDTLLNGVEKGRNGKGNIYVWASGNGGDVDTCSLDGLASSIYTISIGSLIGHNEHPWFSEKCPSTMAVTYAGLVAATTNSGCKYSFTGTSSSAPIASAIFALTLEANPDLTWRDINHLISWTSRYNNLKHLSGWQKNGGGFWVNPDYGFGVLDAESMVKHAKEWIPVPTLTSCLITFNHLKVQMNNNIKITRIFDMEDCSSKVAYIETVELFISLTYTTQGVLRIILESPHGYNTTLLYPRPLDKAYCNFYQFPFTSVHQFGEAPDGEYKVHIEDTENGKGERSGTLTYMALRIRGTAVKPKHTTKFGRRGFRIYEDDITETSSSSILEVRMITTMFILISMFILVLI